MLSGETAKGDYPLEAVKMMHHICREAEAAIYHTKYFEELQRVTPRPTDTAHTIAIAATSAAVSSHASAILLVTTTGRTAHLLSKCRPDCPVLCVTRDPVRARQMNLHRGIYPIYYEEERDEDWTKDVDNRINYGIHLGMERGFIRKNDFLVVITGWRQGAGFTNTLRIIMA
jgi:pyruvate kinase